MTHEQNKDQNFWLTAAAVAALYLLLAKIGINYATVNGNGGILWLPGGLALAVILVWGRRYWPAIFAGAFAAGFMMNDSFWMTLLIAAGNTLQPLCGAWLLNRSGRFDISLQRARDFLRLFFLAGLVSSGLSAVPAGLALLDSGYIGWEQFPVTVMRWWMGDTLGVALIAPLFLIWHRWPFGWLKSGRLPELFALFGLAFLAGQVIFLGWFRLGIGYLAMPFWMVFFLIWAALRFGRHGVSLLLILIFSQIVWAANQEVTPFFFNFGKFDLSHFWLFNMVLTLSGMTLATFYHELRETTRRLQDSEARFRLITELAHDVLWTVNTKGECTYLSPSVQRLRGYTVEEAMAQSEEERLVPASAEYVRAEYRKIVESNGSNCPESMEMEMRCKNGSTVWTEITISPVFDNNGRLRSLIGVTRDISRRKHAEDALQKLNLELDLRIRHEVEKSLQKDILLQQQSRLASMGEMIGNIAHQWRQPINSLGLILADIEDAFRAGEMDEVYLHQSVEKSAAIIQRMSQTIDDFSNFFQIEKSACSFGLKQSSAECLSLVDAAMKHAGIDIVTRCEQEVRVWGYPGELQQALMNLLMNARDVLVGRGVHQGRIEIHIGESDGMGCVSVMDNGGGIAEEVIGKVFDPYFTTKRNGVGIGLYMSRVAIVDHMHGRLVAENAEQGARFSIYLPTVRLEEGGI